jgi:pimeloyl-ACP methyl ester carboxylesterase
MPGVMVLTDNGRNTRTDGIGFFNSLRVMGGSRTFSLSKADYTFAPNPFRVTVSGNISGLQFKGYNKHPIVMVHGWNSNANATFKGHPNDVPEALKQAGYHVEFANLDTAWFWTESFEKNAKNRLKPAIEHAKDVTGQPKVIVIAHSMGGLVSRAYIEGPEYKGPRINNLWLITADIQYIRDYVLFEIT